MPITPHVTDNGNCLTYKVTGTISLSEFIETERDFFSSPNNSKKLCYLIVDFSEAVDIIHSINDVDNLSNNTKKLAKTFTNVLVAILSDHLMIQSYSNIWGKFAEQLGWKYKIFTETESMEEWLLANVSKRYDGFITQSSVIENKNKKKQAGLENLGFILDPLSMYFDVSTALILSYHDDAVEVLQNNSASENGFYKMGTTEKLLGSNSFFEFVINNKSELYIPDASLEEQWASNPSIALGFLSFIGLPIRRPSGEIFGLVCLMDSKPIHLDSKKNKVLFGTRDTLESQLKLKSDNDTIYKHLGEILDLQISLEKESKTDYLTGFYNRKNFLDISESEFSRSKRNNTNLSFIFCDIDHFKKINDKHGHDAGDEVLKRFSSLIKENIRTYDIVWRWGGEEFLILLPETNCASAEDVADKLRAIIDNAIFIYDQKKVHVTVSFGVSEISKTEKINDFLIRLDELLYKAKKEGRNLVVSA
ncbi:MAG: diguanylate cyclase (GGDEF)-like protein [Gammaproteobacteria bacterium]|jgi:diguanylate cyclase (GGDEF)-like protein